MSCLFYRTSFEQDESAEISSDDADFTAIADRFTSLDEVSASIKRKGVKNCGLIFGTWSICLYLSYALVFHRTSFL